MPPADLPRPFWRPTRTVSYSRATKGVGGVRFGLAWLSQNGGIEGARARGHEVSSAASVASTVRSAFARVREAMRLNGLSLHSMTRSTVSTPL
jgi:hypothetical protein